MARALAGERSARLGRWNKPGQVSRRLSHGQRPLQTKERFANKEPVPASLARSYPRSLNFVRGAHFVRDDMVIRSREKSRGVGQATSAQVRSKKVGEENEIWNPAIL